MSNGESVLINIRKMVENGEELSVKQFRIFMLSTAIDAEKSRKAATEDRYKIIDAVEEKIKCLEDKMDSKPTNCVQSETNLKEIDRIRDDEIPALRKASRITDGIVMVATVLGSYFGITGSK